MYFNKQHYLDCSSTSSYESDKAANLDEDIMNVFLFDNVLSIQFVE